MRYLLLLACCVNADDLWLRNGHVWTADAQRPWVESVLIRGNTIAAAGNDREIARQAKGARVIDLKGRLAMPGFNDAHLHFLNGSLGLSQIDLNGICTLEAMQKEIAAFAAKHPDEQWLQGRGWEYLCFPQGRLPAKADLDKAVKERPVFLAAYDGHTAWVNSKALELAGVDKDSKFAGFGEIVRDPRTGEPTGALKEGAMGLVRRLIPEPDRAQKIKALETGLRLAASLGITSAQNANGTLDELELYEDLQSRGKLTVRTSVAMSVGPMDSEATLVDYANLRRKYSSPLLRVGAIKIMMDGVIESYTAAMLEPYTNNKATSGKAAWTPEQFARTAAIADRLGLQIYTHAIGDRAVRMALDGYEAAQKATGAVDARHRIEHIETIHPADLTRFAALGVLPSMQPIHADPSGIEVWSACIGPERTRMGFAWRSIEKAGGRLVFSSDWPASISVNPIRGIHSAVNRRTITGLPPQGWIPEERVSLETALRAYTINAAFGAREENRKGAIRAGLLADLVVLSQDLFKIPAMDIHKTAVDITIFDGRVIHQR
ncbi:MAG: amidohydrolase [Acidobacteria bacterium]|nr:amidohydrolase [Acidobacteriota bacterium]